MPPACPDEAVPPGFEDAALGRGPAPEGATPTDLPQLGAGGRPPALHGWGNAELPR